MADLAPFLMFSGKRHGQALDALNFYVALFPNSAVTFVDKYGPGEPGTEGAVKVASFTLNGRPFMASDSAVPHRFDFTPSLSIFVECASNDELERLYAALAASGQELMPLGNYGFSERFGWVNDRFGVSWQLNLRLAGHDRG